MGVLNEKGRGKLYYCRICKDYLFLAKNFEIEKEPIRPIDGSTVVDELKKDLLITCKEGETIIIHRPSGYERQTRLCCSTCNVAVAYHQGRNLLYILKDTIIL